METPARADLLITDAELVATVDDARREIPGGWVAVTDGAISGVGGPGDPRPDAVRTIDARGCLVTPGLVNTHHHLYQNLTRAFAPALTGGLFDWLVTLYPLWARLDEEAAYVSAYVGLTELALGGCTTSTDHLYVHPRGAGDLIAAEIAAARDLGMRFHPTRGSMSLSVKDGGLPPDSVVQDDDEILAESQRLVEAHHDRSPLAMTRIALAPVLAVQRLDVADEPDGGAGRAARRPAAHPPVRDAGRGRVLPGHLRPPAGRLPRRRRVDDRPGVAGARGLAERRGGDPAGRRPGRGRALPVVQHDPGQRARPRSPSCGPRVRRSGLGVDGSSSADSASLWLEARTAMLQGKLRQGAGAMSARDALEIATRGGAACLGRTGEIGELSVGACGDLVVWGLDGVRFAGALSDPVEAWLRCGPVSARHTVVGGRLVVEDGVPVHGRPGRAARRPPPGVGRHAVRRLVH